MPPLSFTNEELNSITALASALPPSARVEFMRTVAGQLAAHPSQARGAGLVHRIATQAQRDFLNVAVGATRSARRGKWA
jgi:hypothetical protein